MSLSARSAVSTEEHSPRPRMALTWTTYRCSLSNTIKHPSRRAHQRHDSHPMPDAVLAVELFTVMLTVN